MRHGKQQHRLSAPLVISSISLATSIVSVLFAGLIWIETRAHDRASLSPSVYFDTEDDERDSMVGLGIGNGGPSPAVIKSITYYVDHQPVKDVHDAVERGKLTDDLVNTSEVEPDDPLAVGEKTWLVSRSTKNKKELDRFIKFLDEHVTVKIEYCSLEDECRSKCSDGAC